MTLILSVATEAYTLQVNDRLLTHDDGRPFDPQANKAVIFEARDAVVSVGYTGPGYIHGTPTDQWLAEQMTGDRLNFEATRSGPISERRDIGGFVRHLQTQLNALSLSSIGTTEVSLTGWQWHRRHPRPMRPILWLLRREGPDHRYHTHQLVARHRPGRSPVLLAGLPRQLPISAAEVSDLGEAIVTAGPNGYDDAERFLVAATRRLATRRRTIGRDCTSILLLAAGRRIRVRYLPDAPTLSLIQNGEIRGGAFTPWIVAPYTVTAPSRVVGPSLSLMGLTIETDGPRGPADSEILGSINAQLRPARPDWPRPMYPPRPRS